MMLVKTSSTSFSKLSLTLALVMMAGCSMLSETKTPEAPTQISPATVQTPLESPSAVPAVEPLPDGLVQIPVPTSAEGTAAALIDAEHPPVDRYRLVRELKGLSPEQLAADIPEGVVLQVNDRDSFIISKGGKFYSTPTRLRHISENAYWWTSIKARANDEEILSAAQLFEDEILPINQLIFGREWSPGIDNDRRIHIVFVEVLYPPYYGYYSSRDEFPKAILPNSNQKEMFVIDLRDGKVALDSQAFASQLAHEYLHMIQWNLDPNEDLWLNEAMGELARFLSGAPETSSRFALSPQERFALNPDIQLTSRPEIDLKIDEYTTSSIHYAAEKLFIIYLLEQFGPQFIKDLINNPAPGVFSIQQELDKLPREPRFQDVYANWLMAKLINNPNLSNGEFGFTEYTPVTPIREIVRTVDGKPIEDQLPPYGARYYQIQGSEPVKVNFNGSTLARLTPADPTSGEHVWYSNRGDESEFSLSRTFDLSDLESATLNYNVWYQLEEYYDYAYVEVSTDGGQSWEILKTENGTDKNPYDASMGFGYTGSLNDWLPESIDLTPYSGQEIKLRFEVISGLSTNRDGFQLDDIAIPELGYYDSAEDDSGGWEAKGFIRSCNLVPADWIVWLVKASNPIQVDRITISSDQTAEFEIPGLGKEYSAAVVIVSPTAHVTTMELNYELVFEHP